MRLSNFPAILKQSGAGIVIALLKIKVKSAIVNSVGNISNGVNLKQ